jgi:hypothetical protein
VRGESFQQGEVHSTHQLGGCQSRIHQHRQLLLQDSRRRSLCLNFTTQNRLQCSEEPRGQGNTGFLIQLGVGRLSQTSFSSQKLSLWTTNRFNLRRRE